MGHNLESIKRKDKSVNLVSIISHDFNVRILSFIFAKTRAGYIKRQRAERTGLSNESQIFADQFTTLLPYTPKPDLHG